MSQADMTKFYQATAEFEQAAEDGDLQAQASLCILYFGGVTDYMEAKWWCHKAADKGVPEAEYILGLIYDFGRGIQENNYLSVDWYRRAAEQGYVPAQAYLGAQYFLGEGVPRDYTKMIQWYRKAAEQGNASAQSNLGASYASGLGVPLDLILAYAWTSLAVAQCYPDAIDNDVRMRRNMSSVQLEKASKVMKELEQKIIAQKKPYGDFDSLMLETKMLPGCY